MKRLVGYLYYLLTGVRAVNLELEYKWMRDALRTLSKVASEYTPVIPTTWEDGEKTQDAEDLGNLLAHYGSDKSTSHNYHLLYAKLLKRNAPFALLEVGLGKISKVISGDCASIKAFRDWAPNARLYGMDIERRLLFQEDRIRTFWADQFDEASLIKAAGNITEPLDLIIDDGLHRPWPNFNTIHALLPLLKESGTMVIEDIEDNHYFWPPMIAALSSKYECKFVRIKTSYICTITAKRPYLRNTGPKLS